MFNKITRPSLIAYSHDLLMAPLSFWVSIYLRIGDRDPFYNFDQLVYASILIILVAAIVFWRSGLYRGVWRYASVKDLWALTKAVTLVVLLFVFLMFLWMRLEALPRSILVINWFVLMALLGGPRFLYRLAKDRRLDLSNGIIDEKQIPVLLVGAGDEAELFIRSLRQSRETSYRIIGIVAEDERRVGHEIHGISVIGTVKNINFVISSLKKADRPQRLILSKSNFEGPQVRMLLDQAESLGMMLSRVPKITGFIVV